MGACISAVSGPDPHAFGWSTLLCTAGLTCQAAFILRWRRPADPWWRVGAAFTALLLCLGPAVWEGFPDAAARVLLPLNLACNVLAVRTRAPLGWLLACNLTVFSGLAMVHDLPPYPDGPTARNGSAVAVVELGAGWPTHERNAHHKWLWIEARDHLDIQTWPKSSAVEVRLTLKLLALTPRTVRAFADGREVWSGPVDQKLTTVGFPLVVTGGHMGLELTTDAPPVMESDRPGARRLGFALYDPAVTVSALPPSPR